MARFNSSPNLAQPLPQLVILFFARHPEEELTAGDISEKFDVPTRRVNKRLKAAVRDGMLVCDEGAPGRGNNSVYSAGPMLLKLIGARMAAEPMAANAPTMEHGRMVASV
jgi:hypothetical protein